MTKKDPYKDIEICPIIYVLSKIGQKWKIPILWHLSKASVPMRYNELKRSMPSITNIMLTKSLQELEEYGLVHRQQYEVIPPKVEYSLTERGKTLIPVLNSICKWGREQIEFDKNTGLQ